MKYVITVFALSLSSIPAFSTGHGYLDGSIGPSYAKLSKSNPQISYQSGVLITDAYPLNSNRSLSAILSLNGGYEFTGEHWRPAIALGFGAYFNPNDYHFNGQVIETAAGNASTTLYNYRYKMKSTRAMAEIQLTMMLPNVSPFISFGMGSAWNRVSHYSETAVTSSGYSPAPSFHSQTNFNFAYQVGAGLSAAFNQERFSVGYHYVQSGETSFGTRGSAYPYRLQTGSLMSDDVYFNYTHLF